MKWGQYAKILAKIQVNTIGVHPEHVFALAAVYSRKIFSLGSPWYFLIKFNLKTYFYGDTVFSAMQTLAMYRLKMSTVYEVTQTPFVGSFGYCILDHLDYSWLNPHPHLKFFSFFFSQPPLTIFGIYWKQRILILVCCSMGNQAWRKCHTLIILQMLQEVFLSLNWHSFMSSMSSRNSFVGISRSYS